MPLNVSSIEAALINKIAPGDQARFMATLSEADERLLNMCDYQWTRTGIELTKADDRVILPVEYSSIVGARAGDFATGVRWQEIKYLEGGPTLIPVEGCKSELVDLGLLVIDDETVRVYECLGDEEVFTVLAKYAPITLSSELDIPRCQSMAALKQAMYAIIYEEQNDIQLSQTYFQLALKTLKEQEDSYRGSAKKIFNPSMAMPLSRRKTSNFP